MSGDRLAGTVISELSRRCEALKASPKPPTWQIWAVRELEADRDRGPRYSPSWFGDVAATEAGRVRVLRTVRALADAGLIVVGRTEAGRLDRVKLTEAGEIAAAELRRGRPTLTPDELKALSDAFPGGLGKRGLSALLSHLSRICPSCRGAL